MDRMAAPPNDEIATDAPPPLAPPGHSVTEVVERLDRLGRRERVTVLDVVSSFGRSSFLAMLLVPGLLLVSPLSGVPLFSTVCGLTILFVALQTLFQRECLWLPGPVERLSIRGDRLHRATDALGRIARWLDRRSRPRLQAFVSPPLSVLALTLCATAGAAMPLLELIPFSSSLLGAMVSLIAVGLLVGDGIFVLFGFAFGIFASAAPLALVLGLIHG
jgi:hypothetical protein